MNPPYGERISTPNLLGTYKMIGERLKHEFGGNEAWILSYREECFEQIGLKPSIKIPVFNGSLECEFRKYALFDGKMREFRHEGGVVKTEEEKREMAQKHRFKKNREFKMRLESNESNEEGDIRSFTFHSLSHDDAVFARREREDRRASFKGREGFKGEREGFRGGRDGFKGRDDFGGRRRDGGFGGSRGGFKGRDDFKNRRRDDDFKGRGGKGFKGGDRHGGSKFGRDRRFEDED